MIPENAPCLLVVDDDPAFNKVLVRALGQRGFDTYGATDCEGALELARDHEPEFIVLDLGCERLFALLHTSRHRKI